MDVAINCQEKVIERLRSSKSQAKQLEFTVDQNLAGAAQYVFQGLDVQDALSLPYEINGKSPKELLTEFGLGGLTGRVEILNDASILEQIDMKGLAANGLKVEKDAKMDPLQYLKMDLNNLTSTLLFSFKGDEDDDIAVFPFQY